MTGWSPLLERYLDSLRSRGYSPQTLKSITYWAGHLAEFCQTRGVKSPTQMTAEHLVAYRRHLMWSAHSHGRLYASSSVALALGRARAILRWAHRRGYLLVDPSHDLVLKKPPQSLPKLATVDQAQALLNLPDGTSPLGLRDRALLETLYSTGLRRAECHKLDLMDLDLRQQTLWVRQGKGRRSRLLPVGDHLALVLERYLSFGRPELGSPRPEEPALWISQQGTRLGYVAIHAVVRRHARRAGLDLTTHSLRHLFATHMLEGGADLREVQEFLGHSTPQATERYTSLLIQEVRREHRRTHPRARRSPDPSAR